MDKKTKKRKPRKEQFWLVFGESDGWVVHKNEKSALKDFADIVNNYENARFITVDTFNEFGKEIK